MNQQSKLIDLIEMSYANIGFSKWSNFQRDTESQDYEACHFVLNDKLIVFRKAKITPTKIGQFVTIWKRPSVDAEIMPFDSSDELDFMIIHCEDMSLDGVLRCGQFIFPKDVLVKHTVMSQNGLGGKRGFRVYPNWVTPIAKQAIKTQNWQSKYFIECSYDPINGYQFQNPETFLDMLPDNA